MNTGKGYIVPVILILLLLILAGFFVFTQKVVESPVVDIEVPVIPQNIQISTSTLDSLNSTTTPTPDPDEPISNSTTSMSATSSLNELENEY